MGKKTPGEASAEVLKVGKPSRAHQTVCDWHECPVVPPEFLRDWLTEANAMIEDTLRDLISRSDHIGQAKKAERKQAEAIVVNGNDFLLIAAMSEMFLTDDNDPSVSQAFLAGLRLGLLRERLQSLADGRYKRKWNNEDVLDGARHKRNEKEFRKEAEEALAKAKKLNPDAGLTIQKKKAAESLGIVVRTLNRRLKKE